MGLSRATVPPGRAKRRLGELLIDAGLISESHIRAALAEQKKWGGRLGRTLVEMGYVTEAAMVEVLARQLQLRAVDLDTVELTPRIASTLRLDLAERYGVFPVGWDNDRKVLTLATSDPTNDESLREIEFATGVKVAAVVTTASSIDRAIRRYYFGEQAVKAAAPQAVEQAVPASETSYELDQLMGAKEVQHTPPPPVDTEERLKGEVLALHARVESLEQVVASQVKALRGMVELLIEYGLVARDEYAAKVNKRE